MASDLPPSPPPPSSSSSSSSPAAEPQSTAPTSSPYPYAYAPDIIRAHQKDAYFQGLLTNQLADLHRRLLGARSAHAWAAESRTLADLLYLCLTTLPGNRTLGEEYCGLVQVEAPSSPKKNKKKSIHGGDDAAVAAGATPLPSLRRRAAYIAGSILVPYGLARLLPKLRARIRARLQRNLGLPVTGSSTAVDADGEPPEADGSSGGVASPTKSQHAWRTPQASTWSYRVQSYMLANLSSLTSESHVHAAGLALFYFTGSYYELAKRLTGLRYIFTHRVDDSSPSADRAGYELLGVLLVVQMAVQGYLHVRSTLASFSALPLPSGSPSPSPSFGPPSRTGSILQVSLDDNAYAHNTSLLPPSAQQSSARPNLPQLIHTPPLPPPPMGSGGAGRSRARYDLADADAMRWIRGSQQRKCTLCLEELQDPAATPCGHVFCWSCIGDWIREKPECPLCRRDALVQHILPLRTVRQAA
ncbi:peroxisome biogenesis factor 10 [Parahypoxylon ruwenzoriense]